MIVDAGSRLRGGVIYGCGFGAFKGGRDAQTLPLSCIRSGWHSLEEWGIWASERSASLSIPTSLQAGARVRLAVKLSAPPGSEQACCTLLVGGEKSSPKTLSARTSWVFGEGCAQDSGLLPVVLIADGGFAKPDARDLYVGLHSLAFWPAGDIRARATFITRASLARSRAAYDRVARVFPHRRRQAGAKIPRLSIERFPARPPISPLQPITRGIAAPELVPRQAQALLMRHDEEIVVRQFGMWAPGKSSGLRAVRGIACVRGHCSSRSEIVGLELLLNDQPIYEGPVQGGYRLKNEVDADAIQKYTFNVWYDFARFPPGVYKFELRLRGAGGQEQSKKELIEISSPAHEADGDAHDAFVPLQGREPAELAEAINALPSVIRSARRTGIAGPLERVLILRVDQLGDMVVSVPALRRLRALLPQAKVVILVTSANAGLARSLDLFDEVLTVDFPDDPGEQRRIMAEAAQNELRERLMAYKFDLAIDLAASNVSRPLLRLSGARFLVGFAPDEFPWLSSGFQAATRSPYNGLEVVSHSTRLVGMAEWVGALLADPFRVAKRPGLPRPDFVAAEQRYAVLHTGARLKFSRWPRFNELASLLLERTELSVVLFLSDADENAGLTEDVLSSPRVRVFASQIDFDAFDALVSHAAVFVGNDSGPKHLASLRGIPVVSVHLARGNWSEWGQDGEGFIVSRRVPCAGCDIFHNPEECAKDFACITNISAEEIFGCVARLLSDGSSLE